MGDEVKEQTFKEKALFNITAFFVLLGTFSLFAFLFLVPFVIDPAFTTIFMQFEPRPAWCKTAEKTQMRGTKNCTWSSCREGCTREVYNCTQIRVNYKLPPPEPEEATTTIEDVVMTTPSSTLNEWSVKLANKMHPPEDEDPGGSGPIEWSPDWIDRTSPHKLSRRALEPQGGVQPSEAAASVLPPIFEDELDETGNGSEWYFTGAKLFPNVKGCGYPPFLNCTIFLWAYQEPGTNFSCYYSKVDPALVVSELDMDQVYLNLILATAIPIPSFIISVIYLAFAYFIIYAEDPPDPNTAVPEGGELVDGEDGGEVEEIDDKETLEPTDEEPIDISERKTPLAVESLAENLPDIDADDSDVQADELPEKDSQPSPEQPQLPSDLIKPAAMMVVRPSSLQPSGPIAAV